MKKFFSTIVILLAVMSAWAVPARRDAFAVEQPNGDTLMVRLVGDERWHAYLTEDGFLIKKNSEGYYCYAKWEDQKQATKVAVATKHVAKNALQRTRFRKRWINRHIPNLFN